MASATERVVALIVDQEEEDVGGLSGCRLATAACGESCAAQGADGLSSCEVNCGARLARPTIHFSYSSKLNPCKLLILKGDMVVLEEGVEPSRPVKGAGF